MSWISKFLGDRQEAPASATEDAVDHASKDLPEGTVRTGPSIAEQLRDDDPGDAPDSGVVGHGDILASLRSHLMSTAEKHGRPLGTGELQDDVDLYEAGYLDSLMAAEFLVLAEREFGVSLPDWLIGGQANTLETLARYISGELGSD